MVASNQSRLHESVEMKHRFAHAKHGFDPYTQNGSLGGGYNLVHQLGNTSYGEVMISSVLNINGCECDGL